MAFSPVVNTGISAEAVMPPMPAKSVAREVNLLRVSASELRAGIMPQKEMSFIV